MRTGGYAPRLRRCWTRSATGPWKCWGGATFDACLRFLNEDPWERLRTLRKAMPNTQAADAAARPEPPGLQALCRRRGGACSCKKSIENGIDVIRIFDALNDTRNIEDRHRGHQEVRRHRARRPSATPRAPCTTQDYFVKLAMELEKMGADTICIKDMANLLLPYEAYDLVKALKAKRQGADPPAHPQHHRHRRHDATSRRSRRAWTSWTRALSPLGNGTCQPATEPLVATLEGHRVRHRPGPETCSPRSPSTFQTGGRAPEERRLPRSQGAVYRHQHAALPGSGRHALQPDQPAQAGERRATSSTDVLAGGARACARTSAIRRWSRRPARSSARRPCSTSLSGERYKIVTKESQAACCAASTAACPPRSTRKCARRPSATTGGHHLPPGRPASSPNSRSTAQECRQYAKSEEDVLVLRAVPAGGGRSSSSTARPATTASTPRCSTARPIPSKRSIPRAPFPCAGDFSLPTAWGVPRRGGTAPLPAGEQERGQAPLPARLGKGRAQRGTQPHAARKDKLCARRAAGARGLRPPRAPPTPCGAAFAHFLWKKEEETR